MKIILSPIAGYKTTKVIVDGNIVNIDGVDFDLTENIEQSENNPFIGIATKEECTIRYEYDSIKAESHQSSNWEDYTFNIEKGEIISPIKWIKE